MDILAFIQGNMQEAVLENPQLRICSVGEPSPQVKTEIRAKHFSDRDVLGDNVRTGNASRRGHPRSQRSCQKEV